MKLCPVWIKWFVVSEEKKTETKQWFYRKFGIPGVIGCIDGTHLYFQRPRESEEIYLNRKGKHSINAMIVCDHEIRIMAINARYAGSAHDSLVWKHSNEKSFFKNIFCEREHNSWLLGDSGYPLEPWLLTPYRSSADEHKTNFNAVHAKARNIIERCIGVFKGRWRVLIEERKSRYDPSKMAVFANVCSALHNICLHFNVENVDIVLQTIDYELTGSNVSEISNNRLKQVAEKIRDDIKESLLR